jgi:hypothetical protein
MKTKKIVKLGAFILSLTAVITINAQQDTGNGSVPLQPLQYTNDYVDGCPTGCSYQNCTVYGCTYTGSGNCTPARVCGPVTSGSCQNIPNYGWTCE